MQGFLLDLPFEGSRDYLHSTDIYPALMEVVREHIGSHAWVDSLCLRRPFRNCVLASFENSATATGSFRVRDQSSTIAGSLCESEMPVTRRTPFDSSVAAASAEMEQGSARILHPSPGVPPLKAMVVLMKLLASEVNPGQWWFCQMNLDVPLSDQYPLKVRITRNIGNDFLIYELIQADSPVGSARIMFDRKES